VKFTESGGLVRVGVGVAADGAAEFVVEDTGVGMAADDVPRAFEPFVQFGTSAGAREGTGLGLPLTRQLVEAHGGTIELLSAPGRGTRALVRFPRERVVL
jgi:signal transduction histidine kinase